MGVPSTFPYRASTGTVAAVAISATHRCPPIGHLAWNSSIEPTPRYKEFGMDYHASFAWANVTSPTSTRCC